MNGSDDEHDTSDGREYVGEARNHAYDSDFLALMAKRWGLEAVHSALEVGCGVGDWGRLLVPFLHGEARLRGVDCDARAVEEASRHAQGIGLGDRVGYRLGDANRLPFHDGSFDLVTCQTLLIHMPDARVTISEMLRVLRPGGRIAVAEPNNLAASLALGSTTAFDDVASLIDLARFQLVCERGKSRLGEGNSSVGDLVPGFFADAGLTQITVHLCDKAFAYTPPYSTAGERARRASAMAWSSADGWLWSKADTARYFAAGGGDPIELVRLSNLASIRSARVADALKAGTHSEGGGAVHYLVSGIKPA